MRATERAGGAGGDKFWTVLVGLTLVCCLFYLFWDDGHDRRATTVTEAKLAAANALLAENRFAGEQQQAAKCLEVTLSHVEGTSDTIEWTIANRCAETVWFLPWNTPLDASFGNAHWHISESEQCGHLSTATCSQQKQTLKYQGAMAKRAPPKPENLVQLPAAHDVRTKTVLSKYFKLPAAFACYQIGWGFSVHAAFEPEVSKIPQFIAADDCLHVRLAGEVRNRD